MKLHLGCDTSSVNIASNLQLSYLMKLHLGCDTSCEFEMRDTDIYSMTLYLWCIYMYIQYIEMFGVTDLVFIWAKQQLSRQTVNSYPSLYRNLYSQPSF